MKKILLLTGLVFVFAMLSRAEILSPQEALDRADSFRPKKIMSKGGAQYNTSLSRSVADSSPVFTIKDKQGRSAIYAFNTADASGSVFLSADSEAAPVLGYTDNGAIENLASLPPALRYWLDELASQISLARAYGTNSPYKAPEMGEETPIAPLVTTKWDQSAPYNNDCIVTTTSGQSIKCVTGCVATAMAQVMNYYRHPDVGVGSITYTPSSISNARALSLNFASQPFDWDNMLNEYKYGSYTTKQAAAVSYLMKACGYSVEMMYGSNSSGAYSSNIIGALTKYFKYSSASRCESRDNFNSVEWHELVYNHLATYGPVIYNGQSLEVGHSFVCDGYAGNGYFHFNWGWSGVSDGYFLLEALNPLDQGIGGSTGGFSLGQEVVFPIPSSDEMTATQVYQYGSLQGTASSISKSLITFSIGKDETTGYSGWSYTGPNGTNTFNIGIIMEDMTEESEPQYFNSNYSPVTMELHYLYGVGATFSVNFNNAKVTNGHTYRFTIASKRTNDTKAQWTPIRCLNGSYNYILAEKTSSGYKVQTNEPRSLDIISLTALTKVYYNGGVQYRFVISNPSDVELTDYLCAGFVKSGNLTYVSDYVEVTVPAGQTITKDWVAYNWFLTGSATTLRTATEFDLVTYNPNSGKIYSQENSKVTVYPALSGTSSYTATVSFPEAEQNGSFYTLDPTGGVVNVNVSAKNGNFFGYLTVEVTPPSSNGRNNLYNASDMVYSLTTDVVAVSNGESKDFELKLDFKDSDPSLLYKTSVTVNGGKSQDFYTYFLDPEAENTEEPGVDPEEPGEDPDEPGDNPDEPGDNPDEPGDNPDEPGDNPDEPGDNPDEPGDNPDEPGDNPDEPGDNPDEPGDNPDEPGDNPDEPGDNPDEPSDNPDEPGDNPDEPGDNPDEPGDNPDEPGDNPDEPGDNPDEPGDNPDEPGDNPDEPGDNPDEPGDNPEDPDPYAPDEPGDVDGVSSIDAEGVSFVQIFTLQGVKIDWKSVIPGHVYIINGKKILIK